MARLAVNWMTAAKAAIDAKRVFLSMSGFHLYDIKQNFIGPRQRGSRIKTLTFVNSCFGSFDDIAGTALL